jgi:hypothetical protein
MKHKNYKGQETNFKEVTHDHLSNIYWFNKICNGYDDSYLKFILDEIKERFNGELLPYRPQWQFKNEINHLQLYGHFRWNEEKTKAEIIYRGEIIGFYETPDSIRDEKINKLLE